MTNERAWSADPVLPDFDATVLPLGDADDGALVATLVRRQGDAPTGRAVLYVHGFIDYFFQSHVAEALVAFGWDFYALDLRRYGRSLRPGQRPNYCVDLAEYDAEIEAAIGIIRDEDAHRTLVLLGHSTGGLIASWYAHRGAMRDRVDGVVLNSPFFRFAVPMPGRALLPVVGALGAVIPWGADSRSIPPTYGESLHSEHKGEWTYEMRWKPIRGFPIYFGWVRAVRAVHAAAERGLDITYPVLLLHSSRSMTSKGGWMDEYQSHDIVLDVADMLRVGPRLGRDVTMREIPGGVHDLFLSAPAVRDQALGATLAWLDARFPACRENTGTPDDHIADAPVSGNTPAGLSS